LTVVNIVPVPVKGTGYADYAKAIADALAGTTLSVSMVGDIVIANVNISACAVVLNVNISSQSAFNMNVNIAAIGAVTLNVNITGSTTINVNITGSTTLNIDIHAQSAAVNLIGDWAAQQSTDVNVRATAVLTTAGGYVTSSYTVPGGQTFYLTTITCGSSYLYDNNPRALLIYVYDATAAAYKMEAGCNYGMVADLVKPIKIPTGHTVNVNCWGASNWIGSIWVMFSGYLTTP